MPFDYRGETDKQRETYEKGRRRRERHYDLVESLQAKARKLGYGTDAVWNTHTDEDRVSIPASMLAKLLGVEMPEA